MYAESKRIYEQKSWTSSPLLEMYETGRTHKIFKTNNSHNFKIKYPPLQFIPSFRHFLSNHNVNGIPFSPQRNRNLTPARFPLPGYHKHPNSNDPKPSPPYSQDQQQKQHQSSPTLAISFNFSGIKRKINRQKNKRRRRRRSRRLSIRAYKLPLWRTEKKSAEDARLRMRLLCETLKLIRKNGGDVLLTSHERILDAGWWA